MTEAVEKDAIKVVLVTPPVFEPENLLPQLAQMVDDIRSAGSELVCIRLASAHQSREALTARANALIPFCHEREIALIIDDFTALAVELGLDGVHLSHADAKAVRTARKSLGADAILGVFAGDSRHDGMNAGEIGADYVAFGPLGGETGHAVDPDLFAWWSMMIEVPLVAEGALDAASLETVRDTIDFATIGAEIWNADDPLQALNQLLVAMNGDAQ